MNLSMAERLKQAVILLLILLTVALLYTTLHEGGHALAGIIFGGRIADFNVNFFNLGAHVGIDGNFTIKQQAVINVAGATLPLLAWLILMFVLPKKNGMFMQWSKVIFTMAFLNTLLAWIIIPFLYLSNTAPPSDDVTRFISNSDLPPLVVAGGALALYMLGWVVFALRVGNLREIFKQLSPQSVPLPAWKRILLVVTILAVFAGSMAVVFNVLGTRDPAAPTEDYILVATEQLSKMDHHDETIAGFQLTEENDVSIIVRAERLNTSFIDITLQSAHGDPTVLLHGEGFSADVNSSQGQYRLPAGDYRIVLTSRKSPGVLKVYLRLP
jgi:hypothetical protein